MLQRATDLDTTGTEAPIKTPRSVLAWATLVSQIIAHPPHGGYPIPAPNQPAEFFRLYLCMIYNTQSLKYRHSWRYRDRWVTGRALAGPRDVCDSVLRTLLEAGEVEAEDTVCSECSFKICHFFGKLQYPSLFCTSSRAGHRCQTSSEKGPWLEAKVQVLPREMEPCLLVCRTSSSSCPLNADPQNTARNTSFGQLSFPTAAHPLYISWTLSQELGHPLSFGLESANAPFSILGGNACLPQAM